MLFHNRKMMVLSLAVLCLALFAGCAKKETNSKAAIDSYPQGSINMLVGYAPGGATDILARAVQPFLQKALGAPVVIVNLPGGSGNAAYAEMFKAKPDGYTLAFTPFPSSILGEVAKNGDFHVKEFSFIHNIAGGDSNAIFVRADSLYKDLDSVIKDAKARKVTMAGSGIGTASHMALSLLQRSAGVKFEYVSFDSGKGGVIATLGGHTMVGISNIIDLKDLYDSGKLRILCSFGPQRHWAFPKVPTAEELGYKNTAMKIATGISGPPNMPPELVNKISLAVDKAVADPGFKKVAEEVGTTPIPLGPAEFKTMVLGMYAQAETVKDDMKPK